MGNVVLMLRNMSTNMHFHENTKLEALQSTNDAVYQLYERPQAAGKQKHIHL